MPELMEAPTLQRPALPLGKIKTIGTLGPKYQVGRLLHSLDDGDWLAEIVLVESGETTQYRLGHINTDPDAV